MEPIAPPPAVSTAVDSPLSSSPYACTQKLRLMCSYGGHIVPRPLDKTLCYAGGETRIVAIDRRSAFSLSTLTTHLSKSLMNGKPFSLKYQLPNHDLDSLISVSTEEDLANMIDEYDRLVGSGSPSRLRFFLFPVRSDPELHDPTSEEWFIDALRNVGVVTKGRSSDSGEGQGESDGKTVGGGSAVVDSPTSLHESIPSEKDSSFGSTSSSASTSNSPAIRGGGGDEGVGLRLPDFKIAVAPADSLGSESGTPSPNYSPHSIVFQDASTGFVESKVVSANLVEAESSMSSPRGDLLTPVQVPGYILTKPKDQQQQQMPAPHPAQTPYIHPPSQSHYVTQYYSSSVPLTSYTTMYQPYVQSQQTVQYQVNNPQPLYMVSVGQPQNLYERPIQNTIATAPSVAPNHPQVSTNSLMVAAPMTYEGYKSRSPAPEYTTKVYITPAVAAQPVSVTSDDHHHQVLAFPPASQAAQAVATGPPLESTNYIAEYEDPLHAQIYKTQPPAPT